MSDEHVIKHIPQNYKKQVEFIIRSYEDADVVFADGFQKDAIQNATGARPHKKWNNWGCSIYVVENEHGKFVVVEDFGTAGLTGPNWTTTEIQKRIDNNEMIPPEYRLARLTSMNVSGGNITGGGLYGVGKVVYSAASSSCEYYFDSYTQEGNYVANSNLSGGVLEQAYEDEKAKNYIKEKTGLNEKSSFGTRIIIVKPREDLIQAINDGTMATYVRETWWLIIKKLTKEAFIKIGDNKVTLNLQCKYTHEYKIDTPLLYKPNYRVKNYGIYVSDEGLNEWKNISYYRKGMKIGEVDIKEIPEKLRGKFWGYIEVDDSWEDELAKIENNIHYGVSKGKKLKACYQNLKNYVSETFKEKMLDWGYIKNRDHENKRLKEELEEIAGELHDLFDKLGFEDLGKGPNKPDFDVRWQNISYPHDNSETVYDNEIINLGFRIKNEYSTTRKFEYLLSVVCSETQVATLCEGEVKLEPGKGYSKDNEFLISKDSAVKFEKNCIVLVVKAKDSGKEKKKELPFYYAIEKPEKSYRKVLLSLNECTFPNEGSRRVNSNEKINNICYRIENKQNCTLKLRLRVSTHNAEESGMPIIEDLGMVETMVNPYEDVLIKDINVIFFNEEIYNKYLLKGAVEIRAKLTALEDTDNYEKGDKVTDYKLKVFYNCDEKNGKEDSFDIDMVKDENNRKRSWCEKNRDDRKIAINIGHPAFLMVDNTGDRETEYLHEQMLKQYVLLYLAEEKYSMFCKEGQKFEDLDQLTVIEQVNLTIEEIYYKSLTER